MTMRYLVAVGLALVVACSKSSPPPPGVDVPVVQLIPDGSDVAIGGKPQAFIDSPIRPFVQAAAAMDSDVSSLLNAVTECKVDVSKSTLTMAGSLDGGDDSYLVFAESPGFGKAKVLECLERAVARANGQPADGQLLLKTRGPVRYAPQFDGGAVVLLNDDALVAVGKPLVEPVFALIENADKRSVDTSLAKAIAHVDTDADLWVVAVFDEASRKDLAVDVPTLASMTDLTVRVTLENPLKLRVGVHFAEAGKAEAFKQELMVIVGDAGPVLEAMGAGLGKTLETLTTTAEENALVIEAAMPLEEMTALVTAAMAQ